MGCLLGCVDVADVLAQDEYRQQVKCQLALVLYENSLEAYGDDCQSVDLTRDRLFVRAFLNTTGWNERQGRP